MKSNYSILLFLSKDLCFSAYLDFFLFINVGRSLQVFQEIPKSKIKVLISSLRRESYFAKSVFLSYALFSFYFLLGIDN